MTNKRLLDRENNSWDITQLLQLEKPDDESSFSHHDNDEQNNKNNINNTKNNNSSTTQIKPPNSSNNKIMSSKEKRRLVREKHSRRNITQNQNNTNNLRATVIDTDNNNDSIINLVTQNNPQSTLPTINNNNINIDDIFNIFSSSITPNPNSMSTMQQTQYPSIIQHVPVATDNNLNNVDPNYRNPFLDSNLLMYDNIEKMDNNNNNNNNNTIILTTIHNDDDNSDTKKNDNVRESRENSLTHSNNDSNNKEQESNDENDNDDSTSTDDDITNDDNYDDNDSQKKFNDKKRHTAPVGDITEASNKLANKKSIPEREKGVNLQSPGVEKRIDEATKQKPTYPAPEPPKKFYDVLPELKRGTPLLKYGRHGSPHFRQFNLSEDNSKLAWFSTNKKMDRTSINIKDITEIVTGQHTKEFRRFQWTTLTPASFSIIYDHGAKSLNLVAKSVDEMKMWVEALRTLRELSRKGENLQQLKKLEVQVDFRDRNRPQSRKYSGNFVRSHETKEREVNPIIYHKLLDDLSSVKKLYQETALESLNEICQSFPEYPCIQQILSELEERIEELNDEIAHTRNTKIAENDIWRAKVDIEAIRDKIRVIIRDNKGNSKFLKRRWSVF